MAWQSGAVERLRGFSSPDVLLQQMGKPHGRGRWKLFPAETGRVGIDPLQQKNPLGVDQWIGGDLEIHPPVPEVSRENRHDAIQSQIAGVRSPVPNRGFPENGKANRVGWVRGEDFTIFKN